MMDNPWKNIKAIEYEGHMKFIQQHDLLNLIFKEQISELCFDTIGILGIGCGNGLEHIKSDTIVYGYDINRGFLNECQKVYGDLNFKLILKETDLTSRDANICPCDVLISNLVVEYIGKYNFTHIIKKCKPRYVSVVLQMTFDKDKAISESPYKKILNPNWSLARTLIHF